MERHTAARTRVSGYSARVASRLSRRAALSIVGVLAGGSLWVVSVAPAPVAFALAAGLAAGWCAWLESHPGAPQSCDGPSDVAPPASLTSFGLHFDPAGPEAAALVDAHRALAADEGVHVERAVLRASTR